MICLMKRVPGILMIHALRYNVISEYFRISFQCVHNL